MSSLLSGNKKGTLLLIIVSAMAFSFLAYHHSFASMWVEGFAEWESALQTMLGFKRQVLECWLHFGTVSVPLAVGAYIGAAAIYLQGPATYLWFSGISSDPYLYRYTGILFFLIDTWLVYCTLLNFYKSSVSLYGAIALLTTPLFFLGCLTENGSYYIIIFSFMLCAAFFFSVYIKKGGRPVFLFLSAVMLGGTLLTRLEIFVWLVASFTVYLVLVRGSVVTDQLKNIRKKPMLCLLVLGGFLLGAMPMIAYNILCPTNNIFAFVRNVILPRSINGPSETFPSKIATRLEQFWSYNLLNQWPMWELRTPNYSLAVLWLVSLIIILRRWIVHRQLNFLTIVVMTSLPLSILTTGNLRPEHLIHLEWVAVLMIVAVLAYAEGVQRTRLLAHVAFSILILGNVVVSANDWRNWRALPATKPTLLNQSDPVLLASYLSQHHADDSIFYTNIGMALYVDYITVGRLGGEEIMSWDGLNPFVDKVKSILSARGRRRVFVAVSKERDGTAGMLARTNALYGVLEQYDVAYSVIHLQNERNKFLYDVVTIEKGVGLNADLTGGTAILVTEVVDVRVANDPETGKRVIIGSIHGTGLKEDDLVLINNNLTFRTAFGNETWISFSIPLSAADNQSFFTLSVLRPRTLERSRAFTVSIE